MSKRPYDLKRKTRLKRQKSVQGDDTTACESKAFNFNNGVSTARGHHRGYHSTHCTYMCVSDREERIPTRLENGIGFTPETMKLRCHRQATQNLADTYPPGPSKAFNFNNGVSTARGHHRGYHSTHCTYMCVSDREERISTRLENGIGFTPETMKLRCHRQATQNLADTYPPGPRKRCLPKSTLSNDEDLDTDVILIQKSETRSIPIPRNIPEDYSDSGTRSPWKRPWWHHILFGQTRPEQVTEIFIKHEYATDSELGDKFGAKLETYGTSSYKQHFFWDVTPRGPADQMKIRNYDELVLINDVFVPNLTHTDVLNLIHNVKVDGKTRFVLIIRRVEEKTRSKKQPYQWFETSSILVPDIRTQLSPPIIKDLQYQPLENNRYEHKTWCRLRVKGTQLYLNIETTGINTTVLHDDKRDETKNIMQWAVYRDNPSTNKPEFVAALRGHDNMSYVAVDANAVVVSRDPVWFVYGLIGAEVCFKAEDTCKYIACDRMSGHLAAQSEEFFFQRFPLPHDQDYPDSLPSSQSSMSSQSSQSSSSSQSNIRSSSGFCSLDDSDVEMDTSDCVSSPQPTANTFVGEDVMDGRINPAFDGGVLKNTRITRSMSRQTSLARNGLDMMTI